MGIRQLDHDASVALQDSNGETIQTKAKPGDAHIMNYRTVLEGTYYARVEATEQGENRYKLAHGVGDAAADKVAELRAQVEVLTTPADRVRP